MPASLRSRLSREKERLCAVFISTLVLGLIAHGYALLNFTVSHDSMSEFWMYQQMGYYAGTAAQWKIALGRFFVPVYQLIFRGETVTPWFSGMLALVWAALAVWGTACLFDIHQRWLLVLTSGIFVANLSFMALTASYLHDLDADMFAVLAAVLAVLCWKRGNKLQPLAIGLLVIALGIYQSMISVYISLVIFVCILRLADSDEVKTVFLDGLRAIGLLAAAGILYLLLSKIVCTLTGVPLTQQENGIAGMLDGSSSLLSLLQTTFVRWLSLFITEAPRINTLFNALLFLAGLILLMDVLRQKTIPTANKLLLVILLVLLPFGMNVSAFLNNGEVHLLMLYAGWLTYLLLLLLCRRSEKPRLTLLCGLLICLILFTNARFANQLYTRKDQERQATLSVMTRINDRIEQAEGYIPGQTEVAILGAPSFPSLLEYPYTIDVVGSMMSSPITNEDFYAAYYFTVLRTDIRLCDTQRREELAAQAAALPAFPDKNCTTWIDGTLVIRVR